MLCKYAEGGRVKQKLRNKIIFNLVNHHTVPLLYRRHISYLRPLCRTVIVLRFSKVIGLP